MTKSGCQLAVKWLKNDEIAIGCDDVVGCNHGLAVVVGGFKMLALMKEIYLGGWPHRSWLASAGKCPESNEGSKKYITKNSLLAANVATLVSVVGLGR